MFDYYTQVIIKLLEDRPGNMYITPDGKTLYALTKNASGFTMLLTIQADDKNFNDMTPEEINQFIIDKLKKD